MEGKKKKNILYIIIVILALMLVHALFLISMLKSEIELVKNGYSSEIANVRSEISAIYDNVDEQLKKEASLLSHVDYSYGDVDGSNHTVAVTVNAVPKEITEGMQMELQFGEVSAVFEQNGEIFQATIPANLFIGYGEPLILTIRSGEETKTEFLGGIQVSNLWDQFLPHLYADMMASSQAGKDGITVNLDTTINFSEMDETSGVAFEKFMVVAEVNGTEVEEKDITEEVKNSETFADGTFLLTSEKTFDISEKDELLIYIVGVDTLGYVHKYPLYHWYDNGLSHDDTYYAETIYDEEGNVLYWEGM